VNNTKNLKSGLVLSLISLLMICCTGPQIVFQSSEETPLPDETASSADNLTPVYYNSGTKTSSATPVPATSVPPLTYKPQPYSSPGQPLGQAPGQSSQPPQPGGTNSSGEPVQQPGQSGSPMSGGPSGSPLPGQSGGPGPQPSGSMPGQSPSSPGASATVTATVPDVFKKMTGAYSITIEGSNVILKSKGRPSLKSVYYKGTQWESSLYEAYSSPGFKANAFVISEYDFEIKIPLNPAVDSNHSTYKGTIGMAVDGVAIFDRFTSAGVLVTDEQLGFDQNNAHPTPKNIYHYHLEPKGLTRTLGKDALLGFLLDGFPLYGPEENGSTLTSADLDTYHGHFGVTADYPNGIYHYHVTSDDPFIIGTGYYGKPGIVPKSPPQ
jgi:hypothetical protein